MTRTAIVMPVAVQLGGAEQMLLDLLRANRERSTDDYALAFLAPGPMAQEAAALGYATRTFCAGQLRSPRGYVRTVTDLARWLRATGADIALSWMGKAHLYAGPAAMAARVPAVWFQHAIPDAHWLNRLATRIPARAVLCSSGAVARAQARLRPARRTVVVHPGVDLGRYDMHRLPSVEEARRRLGLPLDRPIMGVVARLQRQKGVHVFLEAGALLRRARPECFFVVVGGAFPLELDYAAELSRQTDALGMEPSVRFAGQQLDVPLWMQAMDVLALPSIGAEGFGMTLVEAMALRKPVVATRTGGPEEIIEDGADGFLAAPGNAEELAAVMERALAAGLTDGLTTAAREKAARYDARCLPVNMADALRSVVDGWR